jgi:hypothetical protein
MVQAGKWFSLIQQQQQWYTQGGYPLLLRKSLTIVQLETGDGLSLKELYNHVRKTIPQLNVESYNLLITLT